jgi:copper chaperone
VSTTTTFQVQGMTCGHCVNAVTEELQAINGVQDISIELVEGGASPVTVVSADPIDDATISAAVVEAGYTVV